MLSLMYLQMSFPIVLPFFSIFLPDAGVAQRQFVREFAKKIATEGVVLVIVGPSGGALLSGPARVKNQKRRHGQSLGVLWVREKHSAAICKLSVQSRHLVKVDNQVLGRVQLLLLVHCCGGDTHHEGCES